MAGYLYNPIEAEDDDWLTTESGASLVAETVIGITCEVQAGWQNALLSTEDYWDLETENGVALVAETIGPSGVATGTATFRLAGSVAMVGVAGSAAGTGTVGEAEPEIPGWAWALHNEAARKQALKLRPLVGKVKAAGVAGQVSAVASFKTPFDVLLAKPMADVQFEMDVRAIAAGLNVALPETLAAADLEPVFLALMMELGDA